jgi:hypothetical protein
MTQIVAAVFDDEQTATSAAHELRDTGFEAADLDQFSLRPPGQHQGLPTGGDEPADDKAKGGDRGAVKGAAIGTAVGAVAGLAATPILGPIAVAGGAVAGAYAGSLAGAVEKMGENNHAVPQPRPAGVMVAVHADSPQAQDRAVAVMHDHGARMIERADGAWRNGKWADFDPVRPPQVLESNVPGSAGNMPSRGLP